MTTCDFRSSLEVGVYEFGRGNHDFLCVLCAIDIYIGGCHDRLLSTNPRLGKADLVENYKL